MENKHLIDIAYELAKNNFKEKSFDFNTIWSKVVKETKMNKEMQDKMIGVFYVDLLEDKRFLFIGKNSWRLKEFVHFDELDKYEKALFNFEGQVIEEGFEDVAKEMNSKSEDDEEIDTKEEDISDEDYGALDSNKVEKDEE